MKQPNKITLKDIAEIIGKHPATALRLSKKEGFPKFTQEHYHAPRMFNREAVMLWLVKNGEVKS